MVSPALELNPTRRMFSLDDAEMVSMMPTVTGSASNAAVRGALLPSSKVTFPGTRFVTAENCESAHTEPVFGERSVSLRRVVRVLPLAKVCVVAVTRVSEALPVRKLSSRLPSYCV